MKIDVKIPHKDEYVQAEVDKEDYFKVAVHRWRLRTGYAITNVNINGKITPIGMHQMILTPRAGYITDHRNGDKLDNHRSNLRYATPSQNASNAKPPRTKEKYMGVRRLIDARKKMWQASISVSGRRHYSQHRTELEAAEEYDRLATAYHGEFAVLNFPEKEKLISAFRATR